MKVSLYKTKYFADANLVSYWRMEGNSNDSKSTNHGTDTDMTYGTSYGIFEQGASFNGSTSRINLPNVSALKPTGYFTISAWFIQASPTAVVMIYQSYSQVTYICGIRLDIVSGLLRLISGKNTADYGAAQTTIIASDDKWHHAAGVWDGSYLYIYLDGLEAAKSAWTYAPAYIETHNVIIGCRNIGSGNDRFYNKYLDDIAVFSRALSATEIGELFDYGRCLININDIWRNVTNIYMNVGDTWKEIGEGRVNIGDIWKTTMINSEGGFVTESGGYRTHIFYTTGLFKIYATSNVQVLVVAAGGSGNTNGGGGGGAGGVLYSSSLSVFGGTYTVTVGGAGAYGANGNNSTFSSLTSTGGGCGALRDTTWPTGNGGSGGGGANSWIEVNRAAGTGIEGQGHNGGVGINGGANNGGAGGGGASAVGGDAGTNGGNGGNGGDYSGQFGTGVGVSGVFGGGGGGGATTVAVEPGSGGTGGGGTGGTSGYENGVAGTINTGGGGGGGGIAGLGGSGVVIIKIAM